MTTQQEINKFIYLPVYLSDYVSQSRKLTMLQRGAFIDLSVLYFQENLKLQYTKEQIYRMVFAFEKEEREAVDFILDNYFIKSENKPIGFYWVSNQLNEIGDKVLKKLNASRENGKKGGRGNKSENKPIGSNLLNPEKTILNESKLNQIKLNENNLNNKKDNIFIDFQEFWDHYTPIECNGRMVSKDNKKLAEEKYKKIRNSYSKELILDKLKKYLTYCKQNSILTKAVHRWLSSTDFNDNEEATSITSNKIATKQDLQKEQDLEIYKNFMERTSNSNYINHFKE